MVKLDTVVDWYGWVGKTSFDFDAIVLVSSTMDYFYLWNDLARGGF